MCGKNKVIRKKVIFLSGSAKFSFAYPQNSHLHIRNFLICISAILQFLSWSLRFCESWVSGI